MRPMGREQSEASPVISVSNGCPASSPASRRMPVPELPMSRMPAGGCSAPPVPLMVMRPSVCVISAPSASMALRVLRQSSLSRNPLISDVPSASAASIATRWDMLLSPGTRSCPSMRLVPDINFVSLFFIRVYVSVIQANQSNQLLAPQINSLCEGACQLRSNDSRVSGL